MKPAIKLMKCGQPYRIDSACPNCGEATCLTKNAKPTQTKLFAVGYIAYLILFYLLASSNASAQMLAADEKGQQALRSVPSHLHLVYCSENPELEICPLRSVVIKEVPVIKVKQAPYTQDQLCTFLTGTYCGPVPDIRVTDQLLYDPTPIAVSSPSF